MLNKRFSHFLELSSKVCAVATAAAIPLSTAATVTLFPVTVFLVLVSGNLREKFIDILRNPVVWVFMLFCSMFFIGLTYTTAPWADILQVLRKYDKFLFGIFFFPLFINAKQRDHALYTFMGAIVILLIASYLRTHSWLQSEATGVTEIFKPSIEFNFLMAFAAYICLLKIMPPELSYQQTCVQNRRCYMRYLWIMLFMLITHTVFFRSMGRSGYGVFIGLVLLFFAQKFRWRGVLIAFSSVALLVSLAWFFSPIFQDRTAAMLKDVKNYRQDSNTSVGLRMEFAENSLKIIKKYPIFGTGTGNFTKHYITTQPASGLITNNPHNQYLHITVQFGLVGLIILLLFFGVPLWYSKYLPPELKYIARGAIVSIMLGSLANSWLLDVTEGHFYAYFVALTFAPLYSRLKNRFL